MARLGTALSLIVTTLDISGSYAQAPSETQQQLVLQVTPYETHVEQGQPLVLRIILQNVGDAPHPIHFKRGADLTAPDVLSFYAVDANGTTHAMDALSVLSANIARAPGAILPSGEALETDYAVPLFWTLGRSTAANDKSPQPIPPGEYRIYGTLRCPRLVTSAPLAITVRPAKNDDVQAREMLETLAYYVHGACRWPQPDERWTCGGDPRQVSDQLRLIARRFPNSRSAGWLQYWKVAHQGSEKEALAYARTHPDFPLSDNLMLQAVSRIAEDDARHDQAVALLAELERNFPDGDAATSAKKLREELLSKRRR